MWCLCTVRQMYRLNPCIIQPAFARVTCCKQSTSCRLVRGSGKQPSGVDGHPNPWPRSVRLAALPWARHHSAHLSPKRSVPVHGFGIGPLTRSKHHPERSLLPRCCSRITIYCVLLTRRVCHQRRAAVFCNRQGALSSWLFSLQCAVD